MADNDSISTNSASEGQETNNEHTKLIPKSHELLIKNTFTSLTNHNDDEKLSVHDEKTIKKRVHKAGDILVLSNVTNAKLHTIGPTNLAKKTFCYKMTTTEGVHYFVKIFEDSQLSPTKISKKLFTNKTLKCKFAPYLLLPAFKPQKTPLDTHTYEVVIYPFIKHCNFQDITLKALRQGYINPLYHTTHPMKAAHADGYKWRLLKKFKEVVNIAIVMKDDGNGYCDMDISPDNFIITTSMDDAADNDSIRWDEITDSKQAKCIKIDHESMLKWAQQFSYVQKPMKNAFKPPEVNSKGADDEYKSFDVEKANVYQFGATFVYVLYGQMKATDKDGNVYWKSLPQRGVGDWKNSNWNPKYVTLQWLQKCIDDRPRKRPSYADLLRYIEWELSKVGKGGVARGNRMGAGAANVHRRKVNDFHNRNGAQMINNNGAVTIIHTPHSLRGGPYQRQGHGTYDPYQQQQQQQLQINIMQQQQLRDRHRLMQQQQQQQQNMRRSQQQFMNQQQQQQQQRDLRRAQLQQNQNQQQRRRNVGNNNFNNNQRRKPGNNRRNNF